MKQMKWQCQITIKASKCLLSCFHLFMDRSRQFAESCLFEDTALSSTLFDGTFQSWTAVQWNVRVFKFTNLVKLFSKVIEPISTSGRKLFMLYHTVSMLTQFLTLAIWYVWSSVSLWFGVRISSGLQFSMRRYFTTHWFMFAKVSSCFTEELSSLSWLKYFIF